MAEPCSRHRLDQRIRHPGGPEEVDLDRLVERGVEADRRRRVDDHVGACEEPAPLVVEPQAVLPDVAGHRDQSPGGLGVEAVPELGAQPIEAVVADHLPLHPLSGRRSPPGSDEHDDLGIGDRPQDALDQRSAQEPGGPGDEDPAPRQGLDDRHGPCVYHSVGRRVYHLVDGDGSDWQGAHGGSHPRRRPDLLRRKGVRRILAGCPGGGSRDPQADDPVLVPHQGGAAAGGHPTQRTRADRRPPAGARRCRDGVGPGRVGRALRLPASRTPARAARAAARGVRLGPPRPPGWPRRFSRW